MKLNSSRPQQEFQPTARPLVEKRRLNLMDETYAQDSNMEQARPCAQCGLPLGDICYTVGDSRFSHVHGECMAQRMLSDLRRQEKTRKKKEAELKSSRREEYDIGWKVARMPLNMGVAEKMGCHFEPKGMVCLRLHDDADAVNIVPTLEPAGSVNLEYLSLSLKVRRKEDREPLFSLDPRNPEKLDSMQVKRFEPEWLAGTSVGDVLFQADYHLKELSMGEYEQPVVGMKSCFDFSFEENYDSEWNAREWFVVRKAEVQLSEDNVVIPHVRVGVEAREQHVDADGNLQDVKVTRRNHPLLLYAESFTHNFDLIAERKSVMFNLRELAKASVLAKYLVDGGVNVQQSWVDAVEMPALTGKSASLLVPQLWNERHCGKIRVQEGRIVEEDGATETKAHGVYGGVNFGLDRFKVAAPGRVSRSMLSGVATRPTAARPAASLVSGVATRAPMARPAASLISGVAPRATVGRPAASLISSQQAFPARRAFAPPSAARAVVGAGDARGVDLNLSNFDLSTATRVANQASTVQVDENTCVAIGNEFWENIDSKSGSVFKDEDRVLLAGLFNPHISDRREEADQFIPPDTSKAYLEKLSNLMKEEEMARERRRKHFFSTKFTVDEPGPLFPASWKNYFEIERSHIPQDGVLHERPEYKAEAQMFDHVLESAIPVFDKSTEEGIRYRVYKVGSIEVRTTQEHNAKETVGAVFSRCAPEVTSIEGEQDQRVKAAVKDGEQVEKVSMYVEKEPRGLDHYRYYVVIETEDANVIVSEQLRDGSVTWKENPADLEDRNSLAKTYRSKDCRNSLAKTYR